MPCGRRLLNPWWPDPEITCLNHGALVVDHDVGSLHRRAVVPRACKVLGAASARRSALPAPTLSRGVDDGLTAEFDRTGTRDPSARLVEAIEPWAAIR
jgi:hypothetical protein